MQLPQGKGGAQSYLTAIRTVAPKQTPQLERNSLTRNPIQHKIINLINHLNFVFTYIKSHYRQATNAQEKSTDAEQSKTVRKTSQLTKQPRSTQKNYSTCK